MIRSACNTYSWHKTCLVFLCWPSVPKIWPAIVLPSFSEYPQDEDSIWIRTPFSYAGASFAWALSVVNANKTVTIPILIVNSPFSLTCSIRLAKWLGHALEHARAARAFPLQQAYSSVIV